MKTHQPDDAIVLCGGFGTRLQKVISSIPKPMAPVAGKPFLQYVLDYLHDQHIGHAILAVGYMRESIMDHFGSRYKNLQITYSVEEDPLGTGGGIMQACNYISGKKTFVINGDTFFDISLSALHQFHEKNDASLTIALKKMYDFERYGTVEINEEGKIIAFREKKHLDEGLINAGVYCLDPNIFSTHLPPAFSFEKEILEKEFAKGHVYGKAFDGYFIDIGIPEDYEKAQADFAGR